MSLESLLEAALAEARQDNRTSYKPHHPGPVTVLADLVPVGCELYASKRLGETWDFYLIMPTGWNPPAAGRRWLRNEGRRYWDTGNAPTRHEALIKGLARLVEVL